MRAKFAGKMVTFAIAVLSGSGKPHRSWRAVHTDAGVFERLGSPERFRNCVSWAARPTSVPSKRMSEIGWVSPENLDWRGRDGERHGVAWKRVETEDGASDNAERAKSSCDELREVVTGDVLHDLAAAAGERAVWEGNGNANDEVTERAKTQTKSAAVVGGKDAADGGFFRPQGIKRQPLAMLREGFLQSLNGAARLDGNSKVGPCVFDDFTEPRGRQNQVRTRWRISPAKFRATAARDDRQTCFIGKPQNFRKFFFGPRINDEFRMNSGDCVSRARGADMVRAD